MDVLEDNDDYSSNGVCTTKAFIFLPVSCRTLEFDGSTTHQVCLCEEVGLTGWDDASLSFFLLQLALQERKKLFPVLAKL